MIKIEKLSKVHNKESFDCGDEFLNLFLKRYAYQNQKRYLVGITYVISDINNDILAYITLSVSSIQKNSIDKNKPYEELPVLLIARLAVDNKYRKQRFGEELLKFAINKALELADNLGCVGIVVDSKPKAVDFYKKYGFEEIKTDTKTFLTKMFLPIKTLKKLKK
ncbi:GNAT family N-acetyltransferase [Nautilia sp.]